MGMIVRKACHLGMIMDRGHNLFYFKGITGVTLTVEAVRMWFPWAVIRKVGLQVILVNNLYVASEVGLYSFDYINLSNFN